MLCNYSWPGNVRELKNLVERLDIMVEKDVIDEFDLPAPYNPGPAGGMAPVESELFLNLCLKEAKKAFEREFIKRKLLQHNNNINDTAKSIGVERNYLDKRLKSLNVS
jgi:two-component system, NtrC family, nitrogen regulation response regulator NtrX